MITPTVMGEYIDAQKFWPLYERAAQLDVPLYLHPGAPHPQSRHQYAGYPELAGAMWGFAMEAGLAAMRLICSSLFDKYPNLKIILGHLGEALPFWLSRMDNRLLVLSEKKQTPYTTDGKLAYTPLTAMLKKLPRQYVLDNFYITTRGVMWTPTLLCAYLGMGAEKIFFAVDYPFESVKDSIQSIQEAPISHNDQEKIFHLNAERIFKL
jgi:5-carboxyvanillate decarboxylase